MLLGSDQKIPAAVAPERERERERADPTTETDLLRNGSELLAVMVRASWAMGEETGFVLPSCSMLVGSWLRKASSCTHIHGGGGLW